MENNYNIISNKELDSIIAILEQRINEATNQDELFDLIVNLKRMLELANAKSQLFSNEKQRYL